ncbi:hypothetical protein CBP28_07350, partial [Fischerella thermalis WC559]|uniref:hypothetical protein n=1 Tax=Fischerella thermalis TaxID=372787 RepID=UPI000CAFCA64
GRVSFYFSYQYKEKKKASAKNTTGENESKSTRFAELKLRITENHYFIKVYATIMQHDDCLSLV